MEEETFGQLTTHELKPGGLDTPVTEQNKMEYVDLMVKWRMESGLTEQMSSFLKGFNEVTIPFNNHNHPTGGWRRETTITPPGQLVNSLGYYEIKANHCITDLLHSFPRPHTYTTPLLLSA